MLNMAMGRGLLEEWVKEEKEEEARVTNKKDMEEKFVKKKTVGFVDSTEWVKETTNSGGSLSLFFQLVCKILTRWMEALTADCAARILCEAAKQKLAERSQVSRVLQRLVTLAAGFVMAEWGARLSVEILLKATD